MVVTDLMDLLLEARWASMARRESTQ
jgi:hypothetical protein